MAVSFVLWYSCLSTYRIYAGFQRLFEEVSVTQ